MGTLPTSGADEGTWGDELNTFLGVTLDGDTGYHIHPFIDVKAYGATGDGSTDDTTAIHVARDAASTGDTLLFPPGTYLTTGLTINKFLNLVGIGSWGISGAGAIIKSTTTGVPVVTFDSSATSHIAVRNLGIEAGVNSTCCVQIADANNGFLFDRVYFDGTCPFAVIIQGGSWIKFHDCYSGENAGDFSDHNFKSTSSDSALIIIFDGGLHNIGDNGFFKFDGTTQGRLAIKDTLVESMASKDLITIDTANAVPFRIVLDNVIQNTGTPNAIIRNVQGSSVPPVVMTSWQGNNPTYFYQDVADANKNRAWNDTHKGMVLQGLSFGLLDAAYPSKYFGLQRIDGSNDPHPNYIWFDASGILRVKEDAEPTAHWDGRCFGPRLQVSTKSSSYECVLGDYVIIASGNGTTITLPENAPSGTRYLIKRVDAANAIVVSRKTADTIDGAATKSLNTNYAFIEVISDGMNWHIIAQEGTVA